jgi:site-specific recombinase XerD
MNRKEQLIYQLKRELELRKYAQSSIATYTACVSVFIDHMSGKPSPLPIDCIKDFLLSITNQNYHKQMVAAIHRLYELVLKQPLSLKDIPYPRPTNYLPNILSVQEVATMVSSIENLKHRAMVQLMYSCAMRIGEVCSVKVADVDGNRSLLKISGAKGFKDRYVPIPQPTLILLRTYYATYKPAGWLFPGQFGGAYSKRSLQIIFSKACKNVGVLKKVTPHSLRHSRLTHLKEAGVDIYELKDIAGHNHIKTTEIYLHLAKQHLVDRIAFADHLLQKISPELYAPVKQQLQYA